MRICVVVQARMGSTRLPGKTLLPLAGQPLLARLLERVRAARVPFEIVVATTTEPADDPIVALAGALGVRCFRGHPTDLLDRHYGAARELDADVVVKIPSDCPLIDPAVIDSVLQAFLASPDDCDYCSNLHPPTHPDGNDVEVVPIAALALAHGEATRGYEREHTTPFFWDQPERFRLRNVRWETGRDLSATHRFTIDYPEDYAFIRAVYDELWSPNAIFGLDEILALLEQRPEIQAINARHAGDGWQRHHVSELRTSRGTIPGTLLTRSAP